MWYVFCTTIEIYDKVPTNKTRRIKIYKNECYHYIDDGTFIGFSALIYFILHKILALWRTSKKSFAHFLSTSVGRKCFAWNHPFRLWRYLDHTINLTSNVFGCWIISKDINVMLPRFIHKHGMLDVWEEGVGRGSCERDFAIQVDLQIRFVTQLKCLSIHLRTTN